MTKPHHQHPAAPTTAPSSEEKPKTGVLSGLVNWFEGKPPKKAYLWLGSGAMLAALIVVALAQGSSVRITKDGFQVDSTLEARVSELEKAKNDAARALQDMQDHLQHEYVRVKDLPAEFQLESPASVVQSINQVATKLQLLEGDIKNSVNLVTNIVAAQKSINLRADSTSDVRAILVNREIQRVMQVLGYYEGRLDGLQASTRIAVEAFQQAQAIKVDGKVGKETWTKVRELIDHD